MRESCQGTATRYSGAVSTSDAEVAIAAAEAGAAVVRSRFGTALRKFDKSATDFATDVDIASEQAILAVLNTHRPADARLGEETGGSGDSSSGRTWLIDPLCGTLNFAAQTPMVAVNVALHDHGGVAAAAVADPLAAEVYWTDGRAAYVRSGGTDRPVRPAAASRLVDVNLDPPFPNGDTFQSVRMLADPEFRASFLPRVVSTSLALAWVAAGRRAAYVTDGHLRDSVHFASGIALCQAAGCVVTGLRAQPLHTGPGGLVAAADNQTHAALIGIIERQFRAGSPQQH